VDNFNPHSLAHRAARCVTTANSGDAVILVITEEQRAEAQRLVGSAPVIVATGAEARQFLAFVSAGRRRKR
jgi:glycerate kinase